MKYKQRDGILVKVIFSEVSGVKKPQSQAKFHSKSQTFFHSC